MKLLIMQSPPIPCYLVLFRPTYLLQHPIFKDHQPVFLPECERPRLTPI